MCRLMAARNPKDVAARTHTPMEDVLLVALLANTSWESCGGKPGMPIGRPIGSSKFLSISSSIATFGCF